MDKQEVINLLLSQQINATRQRVDIAQILFERQQHLCAEQVINELSDRGRVSKATVYNTLNLFSQHGLVSEVCIDGGKIYYDTNTTEHHHIYNVDTGELWDIPAKTPSAVELPSLPDGTSSIGMDVVYRVRELPAGL
ncbi:MAG: Fur family transcriptional regulator [Pseudomonadota bacterium]